LLLRLAVEAVSNFLECHHVAIEGFGHQYVGELVQALATMDGSGDGVTPFRASGCIGVALLTSAWHLIRL
jgi:hypothetical protein